MSFADPQSITFPAPISSGAVSLPRVEVDGRKTIYASADGYVKLWASTEVRKRIRRVIRVDYTKISPDIYRPTDNVLSSMSCYLAFDMPLVGFTNAEAKAVYDGFKANITASTDLNITKLLAGES